ncbi:MAG TPA: Yip1 family protein [Sphingobium sp.]|nr:Yip1 family protein [Sphingobium sp.]
MSVETPENPVGSIIVRAKAIILKPKDEWPIIERETLSSGEIFTRYAMPLAAIGPVATFLGGQIFGFGAFGISFRPSLASGLSQAVISYVLTLIGLFVICFVANKLAPNFGGEANSRNAFKLVVYSMTAGWVAGVFGLIPSLAILAIVGVYSFYLFYVGVGPLMKIPADKAMTYTIVTVLCVVVLYLVIGALTAGLSRMTGLGSPNLGAVAQSSGGSVSIPGIGTIDTGKIEEAAKDMERAANAGPATAIAPAALQDLLPASIGSYERTATKSMRAGPGSHAEATYTAGDKRFTLKITDAAVVGAMAGLGAAFGVEANSEDADSYERTTTTDGNLVVEKWNRASERGSFMTMVAKRFMIEADGNAGSIDELKAAVATIDQGKLVGLSRT